MILIVIMVVIFDVNLNLLCNVIVTVFVTAIEGECLKTVEEVMHLRIPM